MSDIYSEREATSEGSPTELPRKGRGRKWAIVAQLEHIHALTVEAINARDFDRWGKAWRHYADEIEIQVDVEGFENTSRSIPLTVHLEKQRHTMMTMLPDMKLICRSRMAHVNLKVGLATVTAFVQFVNYKSGLTTMAAGKLEFRLIGDQWLVTGLYSLPGVDLLCLDGMDVSDDQDQFVPMQLENDCQTDPPSVGSSGLDEVDTSDAMDESENQSHYTPVQYQNDWQATPSSVVSSCSGGMETDQQTHYVQTQYQNNWQAAPPSVDLSFMEAMEGCEQSNYVPMPYQNDWQAKPPGVDMLSWDGMGGSGGQDLYTPRQYHQADPCKFEGLNCLL